MTVFLSSRSSRKEECAAMLGGGVVNTSIAASIVSVQCVEGQK